MSSLSSEEVSKNSGIIGPVTYWDKKGLRHLNYEIYPSGKLIHETREKMDYYVILQ